MEDGPARPPEREWLVVAAGADPHRPASRNRRWIVRGTVVLTALGLASVGVHLTDRPAGGESSGSAPSGAGTLGPTHHRDRSPAASAHPEVVQLGRPLLPTRGAWELYARGDREVIRIEPAAGRITRTGLPAHLGTTSVAFLVTTHGALVRPAGDLPGSLVPDREPARPLPANMGRGGAVLPGPRADEVWVTSKHRYTDRTEMLLISAFSGEARNNVVLPGDASPRVAAEGRGSFYFPATGGTYVREGRGYRRVTTGTVLAAGKNSWLTSECDVRHRCRHLLTDRRRGSAREVRLVPSSEVSLASATVSPDGRYAAVVYTLAGQPPILRLLDLERGGGMVAPIGVSDRRQHGSWAWSPDSAYLFVASDGGRLWMIEPASAGASEFPVELPPVRQLAIRPAP